MKVEKQKSIGFQSRDRSYCKTKPSECSRTSVWEACLMQWIDEVAALVAKRHTHTNVTTASVDNLSFLKGAYPGDSVVMIIGQLVMWDGLPWTLR